MKGDRIVLGGYGQIAHVASGEHAEAVRPCILRTRMASAPWQLTKQSGAFAQGFTFRTDAPIVTL